MSLTHWIIFLAVLGGLSLCQIAWDIKAGNGFWAACGVISLLVLVGCVALRLGGGAV